MICADTNVFIDFFKGSSSGAVDALQKALDEKRLMMCPFVLSELLSSPKLPKKIELALIHLPRLEIEPGFFEKAGLLRRAIYQAGKGVSMADIYIAQACIDAKIPLLSSDEDFQVISAQSDLKLM